MRVKWKGCCFFLFLSLTLFLETSYAQEEVGLPFLKIGVGARQAGMGGVFTGVGDDIYTLYWNPGGLGHIRRWQWSASYNRWFTDVYQASVMFVKQFRALGSRKASLGLNCSYLGMPSWDATGGKEQSVSVGHFVAGVSLGQRLDWMSRSLAVGVQVKAISSRLDTYSTSGVATDVGFLFKPDRFKLGTFGLGLFDYGVFTCGASLLHLGTKMRFDTEASSLPRTWRVGASFRMGRYGGWSLLLASDLVGVRDKDWFVGMGTEVWWRDILGVRFGYTANRENLGDFSFGLGIRWDDVMNSLFGLPTRFGDAFELDVADVGYGDVLQQTYRGTLSHYPVAPEPFDMEYPQVVSSLVKGEFSVVNLNWEEAFDPDPFDEVSYSVVVDKSNRRVEEVIRRVEKDMAGFLNSPLRDSLLVCEFVPSTSYTAYVSEGGIYYWAIIAYDLARHVQLAMKGRERVGQFTVATHDLVIRDFNFEPTQWITTTPEQGLLTFTVANEGTAPSDGFRFIVRDLFFEGMVNPDTLRDTLFVGKNYGLAAGDDTTFQFLWETEHNGLHTIEAMVYPDSSRLELYDGNNVRREAVISVPKGALLVPDSVEVVATGYDYTDIPVVPEVYFELHSNQVDSFYYTDSEVLPSLLSALAERLRENSDITIQLMGSVDALSGERDPALADERADNVKNRLVQLGIDESRVLVVRDHPGKILGRRRMPVDSMDAKWVMEQNRVVTFRVPQKDELKVFRPFEVAVDTTLRSTIPFDVHVVSSGQVRDWSVKGKPCSWKAKDEPCPIEITKEGLVREDTLYGKILWDGTDRNAVLVPRNRWYRYSLSLTDTLGRPFMTKPDSIYIEEKRTIRRREVFGAAKFAQVEPVYQFYWDRLMEVADELIQNPTMRARFEGHACAIGPETVNERLSDQRARRFTRAFMNRLKEAYPQDYEKVWERIDPPVGFGETEPLRLKVKGRGEFLLGDNNTPTGRYLNRRIMVLLYKEH